MKHPIIFTDLDGTLLDSETYSFAPAKPALRSISDLNIPLILCSSKTRTEIEYYREKIGNSHPFISENGGGIFIPKGYFGFMVEVPRCTIQVEDQYEVIVLGAVYSEIRKAVAELRYEGFPIKGFGDMSTEEIAGLTGLSSHEAAMAKERHFDEPVIFEGEEKDIPQLFAAILSKGFRYTQGAYYHILGDSDKGKAVSILADLYRKAFGEIMTIGLGDSPNDIPMLERVDYPVIVQKPAGGYDQRIQIPNLMKTEGAGPEGWNNAILSLVKELPGNRLLSGSQ